eukprot:TRINITY_DN51214_c0_g1_i1.p1 TRINITY_DN51214_c0_g1~~TRINITY_DN51214_c0_g1_i1.p1  ORF type:complete len:426 (-),score=54.17 TRINITY_DN51214_c0_g1_i1:159-1436(-)
MFSSKVIKYQATAARPGAAAIINKVAQTGYPNLLDPCSIDVKSRPPALRGKHQIADASKDDVETNIISFSAASTPRDDAGGRDLHCYRHIDSESDDAFHQSPAKRQQFLPSCPSTDFSSSLQLKRRTHRDIVRFLSSMPQGLVEPCPKPPRVLCVSRRHNRKNKYVDFVGEYHLDLIQENGGAAIIVPRTAKTFACLTEYLPMDGLLVVEGNDISDDVLQKYDCSCPTRLGEEQAAKYASDTEFDFSKDELECALMSYALKTGCPILGLCRGSQMLNALRGGTIIGDIETEIGREVCHLKDSSDPEYDSHRHSISVTGDTPLSEMFSETIDKHAGGELMVNSYHHQAIGKLGKDLIPMAYSPDGVLEGFYDRSYNPEEGKFVVGLQFHPERMMDDYPGCKKVYERFLIACTAFRRSEDADSDLSP